MVNKMWFPVPLVFTLGSLITRDNMTRRTNESLLYLQGGGLGGGGGGVSRGGGGVYGG